MKKSDLKAGWVIKKNYYTEDYRVLLPISDSLAMFHSPSDVMCQTIKEYPENISSWVSEVWGFKKVKTTDKQGRFEANTDGRELIWKKEPTKEYTIEELQEKLGEEFKIVKSNK